MRFCGDCGQLLTAGATFCPHCGYRVPAPAENPAQAAVSAVEGGAAGMRLPAAGGDPLAALGEQLRSVPWPDLLPLRSWWAEGGWRRGQIGLFSLFVFAPFFLLRLTADDQDVNRIAWGFAGYFALLWFVVLYALIRPERVDWWALARVALVTMVIGTALAIFLESHLAPDDSNLVKMVVGVGLPEEVVKALAVYLFLFRSRTGFSTRDYLFAGAVAGLAFGAVEAASYTQKYAELATYLSPSSYTALITWRLLTDSLLHALMAAICAYFIGLASRYPASRWPLMISGLTLAAVLHGAYDSLSSGWPGTLVAAVIVFVFAGYVRTGDQITERLDVSPLGASPRS